MTGYKDKDKDTDRDTYKIWAHYRILYTLRYVRNQTNYSTDVKVNKVVMFIKQYEVVFS